MLSRCAVPRHRPCYFGSSQKLSRLFVSCISQRYDMQLGKTTVLHKYIYTAILSVVDDLALVQRKSRFVKMFK